MQQLLNEVGASQRDMCRRTGLARSTVNRIVKYDVWPTRGQKAIRFSVAAYLKDKGVQPEVLAGITLEPAPNKLAPGSSELTEAAPSTPNRKEESTKEDHMLLRNENLTPEARRHFNVARSPFVDDVQGREDVFLSPGSRYVRAALKDAAMNHGFIAVVGESGSGKSTLVEDLEEALKDGTGEIVLIKPYTQGMEVNDIKGKTLKSGAIAEAIMKALDCNAPLSITPQARFHQLHMLLKSSRRTGHRHLLVVEEAHCLPVSTLKHLKRFLELKDGLQRLLGIALIGQPELAERLSSQNAELREVMQRCEVVNMQPLDNELEAYLSHKFARFDLKLPDVFEPDAMDAIRARLVRIPRGGKQSDAQSLCYPLVVNNLCCRAMNAAARVGYPKVDANVIKGC